MLKYFKKHIEVNLDPSGTVGTLITITRYRVFLFKETLRYTCIASGLFGSRWIDSTTGKEVDVFKAAELSDLAQEKVELLKQQLRKEICNLRVELSSATIP